MSLIRPFPRCVRAEVPSAGFLLSLLRGPQRLLIIPDLLALHLSSSHSGPLQLARVSSLLTRCLPHSACPLARLQLLIAAISDKGDVWGEAVPKVSQGEGLQHLRVCRRCLESHCFDSGNSLFQGVPFVGKSDAWKPVINGSRDTEQTGKVMALLSLLKTYHLQTQFQPCWVYIVCTHLLENINKKCQLEHGTLRHLNCWQIYQWRYENNASILLIAEHKSLA